MSSLAVWIAACPQCRKPLGPLEGTELACAECAVTYPKVQDVWRSVTPDRQPVIDKFLVDYTMIRRAEGHGSNIAAYYAALPAPTPGDPLEWQWKMRSVTWRHVQRSILPALGLNLRVLDLGAGVGWLSNRMRELGHAPMAIDVSVDDLDGLCAARHYTGDWPRVQAEFDRLPLADDQADLVIYNAALHYSVNYSATFAEARRVLRPGGHVLVIDSPLYRKPESGQLMVAERNTQFETNYGTRSNTIASIAYLSEQMLGELEHETGIRWRRSVAWYGWRWWWRPWKARLTGKREPSRFVTLLGDWPG